MKLMDKVFKIIGQIIVGIGFLFTLWKGGVIGLEATITTGIISCIFLLCFQELKNSINPIKNATSEIQKWLGDEFKFIPLHPIKTADYIKSKSPSQMTDLGKQLLEESGAKNIIDIEYAELKRMISQENLKTAYDIQFYVSKLIGSKENEDSMIPLKDFAYKNPIFKGRPLKFTHIQAVMVVYLRDKYLEEHQELLPK